MRTDYKIFCLVRGPASCRSGDWGKGFSSVSLLHWVFILEEPSIGWLLEMSLGFLGIACVEVDTNRVPLRGAWRNSIVLGLSEGKATGNTIRTRKK